jgi:hypothetical protein
LLVQAGLINGLTDPSERIEAALATLTLVKEVPDRLFDQLIRAVIPAAGEFLLDLPSQIGW